MKKVVIVGSGNVAEVMASALSGNMEYQLVQVWARNRVRGAVVAGGGFEGGEGGGGDGRWEGGSGNSEGGRVGGGSGGGERGGEGFGFEGNKGLGEGCNKNGGESVDKGGGKSNNYSVSERKNNYHSECGPCTTTNNPAELAKADIYIISVSDWAVGEVSEFLNFGNAVVAHSAGSVGIDELSAKIENRAVIYPLQTFSSGRKVDFSEVALFVEGSNPEALEAITLFASALSANVIEASSLKRLNLHTAAVFASNFTNAMYVAAEDILTHSQLDPNLLRPLILETAAKAAQSCCAAQVQTGPARRGDTATMEKHLAQLTDKPELKEIYKLISARIWETSKKI